MKLTIKNILWFYAFLLVGLAYIFGLFIDLTGDSGLYAAISKQMVESGDWLNLKINGVPYDQKPHLLFWLAGLGIKIFGNSNFAFKIFPTFWGLTGIYFTYRFGKLLFSEEAGKLAALVTGTSQMFVLYFLDIHADTILQTGVILALWQLVAYFKTGKNNHFIFGFFGVGLAMLSKGPVGGVVPFFFVLIYLISAKKYSEIFRLKWLLGILIILFVISPTLIQLYNNFGLEGIRFYFITNNFGRISGEYAGSSNDPFYYLYNSVWAFLPWTVFVFFSVYSEIKSWFSKNEKDIWGISLLGSVLVFTFILSIAKGKAPNYFLQAITVIAVISGKWILAKREFSKTEHKLLIVQQILLILLFLLFLTLIFVFTGNNLGLPVILFTAALFTAFFSKRIITEKFNRIILNTIVLSCSLNLFFNVQFVSNLFSYQGARQALQIFEIEKTDDEKLYNFELDEFELFYMAEDSVRQVKDWNEIYKIMEYSGTWLYTNEIKYNDIIKMGYNIEKVFQIKQRGMNELNLQFLYPETRKNTLKNNYLIKTK